MNFNCYLGNLNFTLWVFVDAKLKTITSSAGRQANIFTAYKMFLGPVRLESVWFENALEQQHMLLNAVDRMITTNAIIF